ncbi:ParB N-terminal domain-containing protein [Clostridium baratii]|jgi:ParB family chromosome partitioning protein|uniref:ParB/RepB/Spo0J family partition protein n=1 Tax=Clostridium baratii TaxID=1561 RepID=UPI0029137993|nr:ParB N-terminal domain-containing protein [Clostridium baratii]MDU3299029.1 ParB N-terminal domain-containing protein [Clostridioides difficile]MDU4912845.1 ParB N-terminal domain-containing protein [Clostridium baratii]
MSKKFSISQGMLNSVSQNVKKANEIEAKNNFNVQYIDIKDIERNKKNFYEIVNVDELAEDIKMNGLNHNLVVRKLDNGKYELISGERRYTALTQLVEQGNEIFALVPCKVIEANDIDSEIILIQANAQTRELTEIEKLEQVKRLTELYKTKKKNGEKVPGKIREIIANDLKLSPTQVGRYERINKNLIPELKEILENGNLTIANASEFSSLSEDNQKVILEIINNKVEISKEEATELKVKLKKLEQEKADELKRLENEKLVEIRKIENEKSVEIRRIENEKDEALRSKKLISDEVLRLKSELNKSENKSEEEIKELENQLREELKKDLDNKYLSEIENIKNEANSNKEEKERYRKELEEMKAKSKENKDKSDEFKENYKLVADLKSVYQGLVSILKQHRKMKDNKIVITDDILEQLDKTMMATSILRTLKDEIK